MWHNAYCKKCNLIVERITEKQVIKLTHNGLSFTIKAYKTRCENGHAHTTEEEKRVIGRKGIRKYHWIKFTSRVLK